MSELFSQLSTLKVSLEAPASFLFDPKTAAKIDKDVVFTIGTNGFEELRSQSTYFTTFFSDLLNEDFANENCHFETLSKDSLQKIEKDLTDLASKISPFFLSPSCHKILELLIRFYKVQSTIKDELLFSLLPFHGTKYFIRLLMICKLDGFWFFLSKNSVSGYVLKRADIVKQCGHDLGLLNGILDRAGYSDIHLKFAVAVVIELTYVVSKMNESLLRIVFGFVEKLIRGTREEKELGMAVIGHIAMRHNFSPQYLQGIISDLLTFSNENLKKTMQCISLLLDIHVIFI